MSLFGFGLSDEAWDSLMSVLTDYGQRIKALEFENRQLQRLVKELRDEERSA